MSHPLIHPLALLRRHRLRTCCFKQSSRRAAAIRCRRRAEIARFRGRTAAEEEAGWARCGKETNVRPGRHERAAGVVYDEGGADAAFVLLGL